MKQISPYAIKVKTNRTNLSILLLITHFKLIWDSELYVAILMIITLIGPHLKLFLFALSLPCLEKLGR